MTDPEQSPPVPTKEFPASSEKGGAEAAGSPATVPNWDLRAGFVKNQKNLMILDTGSFKDVKKNDVVVCYNGKKWKVLKATPARDSAGDFSRLLIQVKVKDDVNCPFALRDEEDATGGLTVQVKTERKVFEDVVVEPEEPE